MIVIGLTGGIGMGKSVTAAFFAEHGIPVWDADAAVHRLYGPGKPGTKAVTKAFGLPLAPDGSVDRAMLSAYLQSNQDAWAVLNNLIHPLVAVDRADFLRINAEEKSWAVLCDIPLLFENGSDAEMDVTVLCSAAEHTRRARVLSRPKMSAEKYEAIIGRQLSDEDKRSRADFIVQTDLGFDHARASVAVILSSLRMRESDQERP